MNENKPEKKMRKKYSPQFKDQALERAAKDGVPQTAKIKAIFDDEHSRAGAKRIAKRLKAKGTPVSRNRVAIIMRLRAWQAKAARKFKSATNSNYKLPVAPNLLQQNFAASEPNEK